MLKPAYTLIELLIIISITGLLITFGASGYSAAARRQAVKSASETILSVLQDAQKNAIVGKKTCADALIGYEVIYTNGSSALSVTDRCQGGGGATKVIAIDKIVFVGGDTIIFHPLGQGISFSGGGSSTNLVFRHLDDGHNYQFTLDRTGTINYLGQI